MHKLGSKYAMFRNTDMPAKSAKQYFYGCCNVPQNVVCLARCHLAWKCLFFRWKQTNLLNSLHLLKLQMIGMPFFTSVYFLLLLQDKTEYGKTCLNVITLKLSPHNNLRCLVNNYSYT